MRTSAYLKSKSFAVLKSPFISVERNSTMSFYYYADCQDSCTNTLTTLSVTSKLSSGAEVTIWKVRNIHVYSYLPAMAEVPAGTRQLIFTLAGDGVEAGIDDVTIMDNNLFYRGNNIASSLTCAFDQYTLYCNKPIIIRVRVKRQLNR